MKKEKASKIKDSLNVSLQNTATLSSKNNSQPKYDFLIVGAGLYGAVFAHLATKSRGGGGYKCLVIDRRDKIGGNIITEQIAGITCHKYGAHIFHTDDAKIWDFVAKHTEISPFINSPLARIDGHLYNLPFNMNTFYALWGATTPAAAAKIIKEQSNAEQKRLASLGVSKPRNLEEQALILAGRDIYEKLIKGYTTKQWGREPCELPAFIIRRLPFRFSFDNNYFNDKFQGIPNYNVLISNLLKGVDLRLNTDFLANKNLANLARKVIFSGTIDSYYDFKFGALEYRSLYFENEILNEQNYQGVAVINETSDKVAFTRIIEHKHFLPRTEAFELDKTVITKEFPRGFKKGDEPFYPINDTKNQALLKRYQELASTQEKVHFGGRLGAYKYYDMDDCIMAAINDFKAICRKFKKDKNE